MAITRISESDHRLLQNLANRTGKQLQQIMAGAIKRVAKRRPSRVYTL